MANKPSLTHQVAKLIPRPTSHKALESFIFATTIQAPPQQKAFGDIHILIELLTNQKNAKDLSNLITSIIENRFYNKPVENSDYEKHFEQLVVGINNALRAYSEQNKSNAIIGMSGIIANLADNKLFIVRAGGANALLLRNQDLHHLFDDPKTTKNIFSNYASGTIMANDRLVFSTPAFLLQIDKAVIQDKLSSMSINHFILSMEESLKKNDQAYRSGLVVISFADAAEAAHHVLPQGEDTIRIGEQYNFTESLKRNFINFTKYVVKITMKFLHFCRNFWNNQLKPKLGHGIKKFWNALWIKYINKNPRLALALTVGFIIVLLFTFFVIIRPHDNLSQAVSLYKQADVEYLTAQEKLGENNKTEAESNIVSAQNALEKLQKYDSTKVQQAVAQDKTIVDKLSVDQLRAKVLALSDKITGTLRPNVTELADFANKKAVLTQINLINNKLYVLDSKSSHIFELSPTDKKVVESNTSIPANQVVATAVDQTRKIIYFLTNEPSVWSYDTTSRQSARVQLSSGQWEKSEDIALYNDNLYLLSSSTKQIWRHNPTSIGFGIGSPYFKSSTQDLSLMRSLAINGSVFVGSTDKNISLFNLGSQQNFSVSGMPQSLGWAQKLSVSSKNNQLLGLNNKFDRVFTITLNDQGGSFNHQYEPIGITKLSAITSTADQTIVYGVTGSKIYSFQL